ncbi:cytochrome b/b6 domain-containing protein [Tropicimonas sp.]|uniref:cytochrome b/b6 domain-containing protein n=1 Tax=Tropicimonas sp. TaxID=2067044 RepID=UPI003A84DFE4
MAAHPSQPGRLRRVLLWDPAVRAFHWSLVICVAIAWYLGQFGPGIMTLHFRFGYAVIALLAFRVLWGLFGAWPARFSDFLYGPKTFFGYVRGIPVRRPSYWPGHNPLGALSVFALLAALGFQAYTGLYANPDDFINYGPLYNAENEAYAKWATGWHQAMPPVILLLVLLHVGAIVYYRYWKGENLVMAMLTGRKVVSGQVPAERVIEELGADAG